MYTLRELEVLVAGGESEVLELKASTAEMDRAARTVAGMANQGGGLVLVGVRPDGAIVGQETSERTLEKIATQLARISPRPIFSVTTTPVVTDRSVVVIRVDAGPLRPYRCNGTAYMRAGASTLELSEEQSTTPFGLGESTIPYPTNPSTCSAASVFLARAIDRRTLLRFSSAQAMPSVNTACTSAN